MDYRFVKMAIAGVVISSVTSVAALDPDPKWVRTWDFHPGYVAGFNASFEEELGSAFMRTGDKVHGEYTAERKAKEISLYNRAGVTSSIEPETKVLALTIDSEYGDFGAWKGGPNITTSNLSSSKELLCHYGTYSTRVKIPSAKGQPNIGAVVGFYTYYNDQYNELHSKDWNKNGLPDNSEIDIEWLIADPEILYIGGYVDYQEGTNLVTQIKRTVNLRTGKIYYTNFMDKMALGNDGVALTDANETSPTTIRTIPDFDASKQFYTYGFDWLSTGIRWWILNPANEKDTIVLWDYKGPTSRFTHKPAKFMANFWHTNDWGVVTNPSSKEAPKSAFTAEFDWMKFTPKSEVAIHHKSISRTLGGEAFLKNGVLNLTVPSSGVYDIQLIQANGRIVYQNKSVLSAGLNTVRFDGFKESGMLVLNVSGSGVNLLQKMIF